MVEPVVEIKCSPTGDDLKRCAEIGAAVARKLNE
jgi:hypothetical protein